MSKVYFSIGSNKGNRSGLINEAIDKIDIIIGKVVLKSSIYETKSWGFNSNNFYNICILLESTLTPELILNKILAIEKDMGRLKTTDQYSERCIDIDMMKCSCFGYMSPLCHRYRWYCHGFLYQLPIYRALNQI